MSQASIMLKDTQASRRRPATWVLVAGGTLSALNGAAHFVLPVIYPWQEHVEGLYEPVRWALFATTIFFALLLLLGGVLTAAVALASDVPRRVTIWIASGMAFFWIVGAGYEMMFPFPDPVVRWALPVFSLIVAGLHVAGVLLLRPRSD